MYTYKRTTFLLSKGRGSGLHGFPEETSELEILRFKNSVTGWAQNSHTSGNISPPTPRIQVPTP